MKSLTYAVVVNRARLETKSLRKYGMSSIALTRESPDRLSGSVEELKVFANSAYLATRTLVRADIDLDPYTDEYPERRVEIEPKRIRGHIARMLAEITAGLPDRHAQGCVECYWA